MDLNRAQMCVLIVKKRKTKEEKKSSDREFTEGRIRRYHFLFILCSSYLLSSSFFSVALLFTVAPFMIWTRVLAQTRRDPRWNLYKLLGNIEALHSVLGYFLQGNDASPGSFMKYCFDGCSRFLEGKSCCPSVNLSLCFWRTLNLRKQLLPFSIFSSPDYVGFCLFLF